MEEEKNEKPKEEEKNEKPKEEKPKEKHDGKSLEELSSKLDEIMARLSVIEQTSNEKPKDEKPKEEKPKEDKGAEVESASEIEKLLNV